MPIDVFVMLDYHTLNRNEPMIDFQTLLTKICSNCLKSVVQSEDFNQKFATIRQEIFTIGDLGRAEIHFLTITDRLAAECFERAQPFSSSPSLGPRSFATRSRKGLVPENFAKIQKNAEILLDILEGSDVE